MSVADVKAHLASVLRKLEGGRDKVIVERRGQPVAVLHAWTPQDEDAEQHWSDKVLGIAGEIPDFEALMQEVVASRAQATPREVEL